jgi:glycosyltransferase involved in cell wall biosynthesis
VNILLVANGYPPTAFGGVELYVAGLAQAMRAHGDTVAVICAERHPDLPDGQILEDVVENVPVFRVVNDFKRLRVFHDLYADERIDAIFEELLRQLHPDFVHFNHLIGLSATLPYVAQRHGVPSLFTAHDFWPICQRIYLLDFRQRTCPGPVCGGDCYRCVTGTTSALRLRSLVGAAFRKLLPASVHERLPLLKLQATPGKLAERTSLFRSVLAQTAGMTVPSHFVKEMFVCNDYPTECIEVVPLGLDMPGRGAQKKFSTGTVRVAVIASLIPWKGADVLLRAFCAVEAPNLRLSLYGRDDIEPAYARTLKQMAAGDARITFEGVFAPEQKDAVYRYIDLLVIPSIGYESFSLVAREALLRGIPVVASANGALPEIVRDGENGFLFEPGDVDALAAILRRVAEEPKQLTRMVTSGPFPILTREEHAAQMYQRYVKILEAA